ncbi:MAG: ACP S-malonyltransferase [Proteobacteria bacterium]|jgi:[acyl-carrier-protein] S-malonyltransferase|nr:ACP S-malonyltransferase [Pseudomonadota bacterium]
MSFSFVFPGQGSQRVGMLSTLAEHTALVTDTFSEASDALAYDLWDLCQNDPNEQLSQTEFTQPALLAAGVAVWKVWLAETGLKPASMAGHSLAEFTAFVCAGALPFSEAVKLVRDRGVYMQQAVPQGVGGMAAVIGLDDEGVQKACEKYRGDDVLQPVNYNAPGQVVVAGHVAAIERLASNAKEVGAKRVLPLSVSVPAHSELMMPAAEMLAERLESVSLTATNIPVYHNVDYSVAGDVDSIKAKLVQQLHSPVHWSNSIRAMRAAGTDTFVESGPGKILGGLIKRIDRDVTSFNVDTPEAMHACASALST